MYSYQEKSQNTLTQIHYDTLYFILFTLTNGFCDKQNWICLT